MDTKQLEQIIEQQKILKKILDEMIIRLNRIEQSIKRLENA